MTLIGPTRNDEVCGTCGQSARYCPGHMGHISLPLPVFNPVFFKMLFKVRHLFLVFKIAVFPKPF